MLASMCVHANVNVHIFLQSVLRLLARPPCRFCSTSTTLVWAPYHTPMASHGWWSARKVGWCLQRVGTSLSVASSRGSRPTRSCARYVCALVTCRYSGRSCMGGWSAWFHPHQQVGGTGLEWDVRWSCPSTNAWEGTCSALMELEVAHWCKTLQHVHLHECVPCMR